MTFDLNCFLQFVESSDIESVLSFVKEFGSNCLHEPLNDAGETAIDIAAFRGDLALIELCISNCVSVNPEKSQEYISRSPLVTAAFANSSPAVLRLLEAGANPNCDSWTYTALTAAIANNFSDVVSILLQPSFMVNVNMNDQCGRTPLVWAIHTKNQTVVQMLLDSGVQCENFDTNLNVNFSPCPLNIAAFYGYVDIVELLIRSGRCNRSLNSWILGEWQSNSELPLFYTPLHWAASCLSLTLILYLCENFPSLINCRDNLGRAALHVVCSLRPNKSRLSLPNQPNIPVTTTLCRQSAIILINAGASISLTDRHGMTPIDGCIQELWCILRFHSTMISWDPSLRVQSIPLCFLTRSFQEVVCTLLKVYGCQSTLKCLHWDALMIIFKHLASVWLL